MKGEMTNFQKLIVAENKNELETQQVITSVRPT